MASIVLRPSPMELGLHRGEYDALAATLQAQGHDVTLEIPVEERFGLPGAEIAYQLIVVVAQHAEGLAIDALILDVGRCLVSKKHRRRRRAQIRDAVGKVRDFDLDPPDDE
jgi:hypothetical protein